MSILMWSVGIRSTENQKQIDRLSKCLQHSDKNHKKITFFTKISACYFDLYATPEFQNISSNKKISNIYILM